MRPCRTFSKLQAAPEADLFQLPPGFKKGRATAGQGVATPWIAALRGLRQAGSVEPVTVQSGSSSPRQIGGLRSP